MSKLVRTAMDLGRQIGRSLAALRRHISRKLSNPKDLSQFDLSETLGKRRPNWSRRRAADSVLETEPLNRETPMFAPMRSRYARVSAVDSLADDDADELLEPS